jgi:DNA-binding NarL/FixJ family response regulator
MNKVSVFLTDWQVLFREGIHFTLSGEEDLEVIGEDTGNEQALAFVEENIPQVAIMNANHGPLSGIEATRRIKQSLPEVAVILVMDNDNKEDYFAALKSGANACLTKDIDPESLVSTVRQVAQGNYSFSEAIWQPEVAARMLDEFEASAAISKQVGDLLAHLTAQEIELLRHIAGGGSKEQLLAASGAGEEVITHRWQSILQKLVANDHKQTLLEAAQNGLSALSGANLSGKPGVKYITRGEFDAFKESLKERFRSLSGELV